MGVTGGWWEKFCGWWLVGEIFERIPNVLRLF